MSQNLFSTLFLPHPTEAGLQDQQSVKCFLRRCHVTHTNTHNRTILNLTRKP